ncbi:MAG: hypothetical protein KDE26_09975 [Bacteroidetes bacterium]|nr:hypothetical protein [Bacteroidota bacterium]MCB0843568.1 hypothetical protein [Bacteroidota bacterium]
MNVLFHIAAGTAIIANSSKEETLSSKDQLTKTFTGFTLGVISHGILDYSPHCYPVNSKVDVIVSLIIIIALILLSQKVWKFIVGGTLFGCIFPDLVDLSPGMINSLFGMHLPTFPPVFPWHFPEYSGSIYSGDCDVSFVNHLLTLFVCGGMVWLNRKIFVKIFKRINIHS